MNQQRLNSNPCNYFTGSVYQSRLKTKDDVERFFSKDDRIIHIWFQLEKGKEGNLHWQYTIRTTGQQQRYSYWWRVLGFKPGEWIDGALKIGACLSYVKKSSTRVEGPFEWIRKPFESFKYDPALGDKKNLAGLLSNKLAEMKRWQDWLDKNAVVNAK